MNWQSRRETHRLNTLSWEEDNKTQEKLIKTGQTIKIGREDTKGGSKVAETKIKQEPTKAKTMLLSN